MAWWLQGDLQPFAHFRSGMGRIPAAHRAVGLRPVLTLCRGWVRGREQSKTCREQAPCGQSTRR